MRPVENGLHQNHATSAYCSQARVRFVFYREKVARTLCLIGFIMTAVSSYCQQIPEKWINRIQIVIDADDDIKDEVSSYLMREFRSLGDVEGVESNPQFTVRVVALRLRNVAGQANGIALSVVVARPAPLDMIRSYYLKPLDERALKAFNQLINGSEFIEGHYLQIGGKDDLESVCKKVVAKIDSNSLERMRKTFQEYKDSFKKTPVETK
jgi:hypothetical protein